jgi:quinol monooxygenase YgiN
MYIVHVHVKVKSDRIQDFVGATIENARKSQEEPGVVRFDVIQQIDDPSLFILVEAYRTEADPAKHKDTLHYKVWRDKVENMMAEPRYSIKFLNCFPVDSNWRTN